MIKFLHTLLAACILTAAAFSNIAVYQCIISGSFCISKTCCAGKTAVDSCCIEDTSCCSEEKTCCSEADNETILHQGDCCVEFDLGHDVLSDMVASPEKQFKLVNNFDSFYIALNDFHFEVSFLDIRGSPPTESVNLFPSKSHTYKLNCSYLC